MIMRTDEQFCQLIQEKYRQYRREQTRKKQLAVSTAASASVVICLAGVLWMRQKSQMPDTQLPGQATTDTKAPTTTTTRKIVRGKAETVSDGYVDGGNKMEKGQVKISQQLLDAMEDPENQEALFELSIKFYHWPAEGEKAIYLTNDEFVYKGKTLQEYYDDFWSASNNYYNKKNESYHNDDILPEELAELKEKKERLYREYQEALDEFTLTNKNSMMQWALPFFEKQGIQVILLDREFFAATYLATKEQIKGLPVPENMAMQIRLVGETTTASAE